MGFLQQEKRRRENKMSKEWSNGLFECFGDCGSCMYAWCCPCCAAGAIWEGAEMGGCFIGCLLFCLLEPCHPCIVTGPLREKKGIEGSTRNINSYSTDIQRHILFGSNDMLFMKRR